MEHYCVTCRGHFDDRRYDIVVGRCTRCAKKHIKRNRTIERIHAHYSDVQAGALMWWGDKLVLVMEKTSTGWVVRHLETGNNIAIVVNGYDTFESFLLMFRRIEDDEKS